MGGMLSDDIDSAARIAAADHPDPFSFLGMHAAGDGVVVRAFLPGARAAEAIDRDTGQRAATMKQVHDTGVFVGQVARRGPFAYRLRVDYGHGFEDYEDPYRFGTLLGELDVYLMAEGTHHRLYERLGAHCMTLDGVAGVAFAVWAPNARRVSVVGDFNMWDGRRHPMRLRHESGVWELFIPGVAPGALYKYEIKAANGAVLPLKADPVAFFAERPPSTASIVYDLGSFEWMDQAWMRRRATTDTLSAPISVYEVHLGSWRRRVEQGGRYLTYTELAQELVTYVQDMGFTHVEFMPVSEHPFDGSWGYQPTGMFAATSRYGTPDEFRGLVDRFHQAGIGVILDWVPGHFPDDPHGLANFDGTHLYEHANPAEGRHIDWDTLIYNYGRNEVANFLISSGAFWLDRFHIDGLRVDAVASMLYRDYSREPGEWVPNRFGGRENLEAVDFLRRFNTLAYGEYPGVITIAEESTSWPMVSRPVDVGGLGFGYKWNLGWMHDTLGYLGRDPVHRRYHHNELTFGFLYAFSENFVLTLSHDEVVHGKGSLIAKMAGDRWQKFANLRAYYVYMYASPGKKLLFMGDEFAQEREWNHQQSLDWHLLDDPMHAGVQRLVWDLNRLYRGTPALHQQDCVPAGFEWIDGSDEQNSVLAFIRRARDPSDYVVVVCNFTPQVRREYRVGVPEGGAYAELVNSDSGSYGGSNVGNMGRIQAESMSWQGRPYSLSLVLPPLSVLILRPVRHA
jgi:1,4-alpha-glucan branching enzyme